jgi:hypothetical protein
LRKFFIWEKCIQGSPIHTDYLLCVQTGNMPKTLPVDVLEAKKET